MTESIVMKELREIRDRHSERHLVMTEREQEEESQKAIEWLVKVMGKPIVIVNKE